MWVARRSSIEPHSDAPRFGVMVAVAAPARSCCLSPMLWPTWRLTKRLSYHALRGTATRTDRRRHTPAACDIVSPFAGTAPDIDGGMTHVLETSLECDRRVNPGTGRYCDLLPGLSEGQRRPCEPAERAEGGGSLPSAVRGRGRGTACCG